MRLYVKTLIAHHLLALLLVRSAFVSGFIHDDLLASDHRRRKDTQKRKSYCSF